MEKTRDLFLKALHTAFELSEACLKHLAKNEQESALNILDNRSRVISIVLHLEERLRSSGRKTMSDEEEDLVARLLAAISELDQKIHESLEHERLMTQNEIAKTRKNKENFKGYNLNDLK